MYRSLFSKRLIAMIVALFLYYVLSFLPIPFIATFEGTIGLKLVASLLPQSALYLGLEVYERAEVLPRSRCRTRVWE